MTRGYLCRTTRRLTYNTASDSYMLQIPKKVIRELCKLGIQDPDSLTLTLYLDKDNKPRLVLEGFTHTGILRTISKKDKIRAGLPEGMKDWVLLRGSLVKEEPSMKFFVDIGTYLSKEECERRGKEWSHGE